MWRGQHLAWAPGFLSRLYTRTGCRRMPWAEVVLKLDSSSGLHRFRPVLSERKPAFRDHAPESPSFSCQPLRAPLSHASQLPQVLALLSQLTFCGLLSLIWCAHPQIFHHLKPVFGVGSKHIPAEPSCQSTYIF